MNDISNVLTEAALWLISVGQPLWDTKELSPDALIRDVESGKYLVGVAHGRIVGTVRFQLSDFQFWPDAVDGEAAYIHKLAVRRFTQKSGVSLALIQFAVQRAKEFNRPLLRLDCVADRSRLRRFYEMAGFRHHSDRQCGPLFVARYETDIVGRDTVQFALERSARE